MARQIWRWIAGVIGIVILAVLVIWGWGLLQGRAAANAQVTATPTSVPAAPTSTPVPTPTATQVAQLAQPVAAESCEGIHDYQLQDLPELSADVEYIHIQWYEGGDPEKETLLPPGRYIIQRPLKGHVWELGPACTADGALKRHVGPSIERRRMMKANNAGYVHWTELVKNGILTIIWQKEPVPVVGDPATVSSASQVTATAVLQKQTTKAPTATPVPKAPVAAAPPIQSIAPAAIVVCPDGIREDHLATVDQTWTPKGEWRIVNFWSNQPGADQTQHKLLLAPSENPLLLGGGDSWSWPNGCEQVVREQFAKNSKPAITLGDLRTAELIR